MTETEIDTRNKPARAASRIEGGIDAIVIGATVDGLAAAAYFGKAGLKTVLLEAGAAPGGAIREREFAPGFRCVDGEHLIFALDAELVGDLDLYRFGLDYANRRLDSVYFFGDVGDVVFDGDPHAWKQSLASAGFDEVEAFGDFVDDMLAMAELLRAHVHPSANRRARLSEAMFEQIYAGARPERAAQIERALVASVDDMLDGHFTNSRLKRLLTAEAALRMAAAPHDPFSFLALPFGLTGEVAGLQGARAYAAGGAVTIVNALRRAAQAAKVEFRAAASVKSVMVEWDQIAGVEFVDGGQIRAPIVVNAFDARRAFVEQIGVDKLDIEFQQELERPAPKTATARLHFALKGAAADPRKEMKLMRRLVFAPSHYALRRAYHAARTGKTASPLIVEALFTSVFDRKDAPADKQVLSVMAHPVPFDSDPPEGMREEIIKAVIDTLELMAPGLSRRIEASDLRLPADMAAEMGAGAAGFAARPVILEQWARAQFLVQASRIEGYYFCGPEAQIGAGISGAAGRIAAKAAIAFARKRAGFL